MLFHSRASLYVFIGCRWLFLLIGLMIYTMKHEISSSGLVLAASMDFKPYIA